MPPVSYHHPTRRELTDDLFDRLRRVTAATGTVAALVRGNDTSTTDLTDALQALERDLLLAMHEAERARNRLKQ
jgi:hypothetical protein